MAVFVRNIVGFPANPVEYPKGAGTLASGALVTVSAGAVVASAHNSTTGFGVVAETSDGSEVLVYDNPFNVYRIEYKGTGTPKLGQATNLKSGELDVINADTTTGPLVVVGVDTDKKTCDFIIKTHTFK